MEDKMGGISPREYFMKSSAGILEIGLNYFRKNMLGKDLTHIFVPTDWLSPEQQFKFFITSLDDYFYSESTEKKRSRVCPTVDASLVGEQVAKYAQKKTQLPCFNITGKSEHNAKKIFSHQSFAKGQ